MLKCEFPGMNVQRRLYEGREAPKVLFETETWNIGAAEKRLDIMERGCLKSIYGVIKFKLILNEVMSMVMLQTITVLPDIHSH